MLNRLDLAMTTGRTRRQVRPRRMSGGANWLCSVLSGTYLLRTASRRRESRADETLTLYPPKHRRGNHPRVMVSRWSAAGIGLADVPEQAAHQKMTRDDRLVGDTRFAVHATTARDLRVEQ